MNLFAIRVCRHCRETVGMDDTVCKKCKRKLMNPDHFKAVFFTMIAIIIIVYASLFFAYFSLQQAYAATCQKGFYTKDTVPQDVTCNAVCVNACLDKNAGKGSGVLLTSGYNTDTTSVTLSCYCNCESCVE